MVDCQGNARRVFGTHGAFVLGPPEPAQTASRLRLPDGMKMEGLTYCGGLSRYTTTLLARVNDSPVMVFIDRANADSHPADPPSATGLHLFRQELGPLVMYELTPLDQPMVMSYLHLVDAEHCR